MFLVVKNMGTLFLRSDEKVLKKMFFSKPWQVVYHNKGLDEYKSNTLCAVRYISH